MKRTDPARLRPSVVTHADGITPSVFAHASRALAMVAVLAACASAQAPTKDVSVAGDHVVKHGGAGSERAATAVLSGKLLPSANLSVAGVTIVASPLGADAELFPVAGSTETDANGEFDLRVDEGLYSISVLERGAEAKTHAALLARERAVASWTGARCELARAEVDLPMAGSVTSEDGTPAMGARVHVERREDGAMLHVEADAKGAFAITLPRGTWRAFAERGALSSEWQDRVGPAGHKLVLASRAANLRAPAPAAVVDELAAALAHAKAPAGDRVAANELPLDVAALAKELSAARIVGVGDALRGTHEELAFGAQLFRALVEQHGFQLLALDAPFGELWNLNTWLLTGEVDGDALFGALSWGEWTTVELQELLRWMRAWNADEKHTKKLQVVGLDVLHTRATAVYLTDYYPRADMVAGQRFSGWMAAFRTVTDKGLPPYERFDEEDRESLRLMMSDLVSVYPDERDNYTQHVSVAEYEIAGQHIRTLGACEEILRLGGQGWTTRDRERFMPERLDWMLARCGEGAKAMVWARNALVGVQGEAEFGSLGWWLKHQHGDAFTSLAVCVGSGNARLPDGTVETKGNPPPATFKLAEPAPGTLEHAFAATKKPAGVVDVRRLPEKGAARAWLGAEHLRRGLDGGWRGELTLLRRAATGGEFDRVVWVRDVRAAVGVAR
ncbi:MAG: erythromycin esterase family protein [Planctomycetes bacterium]|nr:erythromycin esterase family protein [Planctomycetota bacterium]